MDKDTFILNNQTYSNNNHILLGIINEFHQISNSSHENLTIKRISDIIIKMNFIINENKKTRELIMNQFSKLENQIQQLNQNLQINNMNNHQELKGIKNGFNWRYVGQAINGLREGKGTCYWEDGERYEGDYRHDNKEGKGIYYHNNGDRYDGYWRNDKREGKGIMYYNDGDRSMGDYHDGKAIGKHVSLTRNGEVEIKNY